jgi:branched-chain amino acid transport system ATP-binding protein/neutral amino acid transport system ATP-binding protein
MAEGRRLTEGSFAEVAEDPRVQEAYMGRRAWAS